MRNFPPTHPGEILLEEFMKPLGLSQYRLAKDISVPAMLIGKICNQQGGISADTALRLARYFVDSEKDLFRGDRDRQSPGGLIR